MQGASADKLHMNAARIQPLVGHASFSIPSDQEKSVCGTSQSTEQEILLLDHQQAACWPLGPQALPGAPVEPPKRL